MSNEIVIYQPNEATQLEVKLDNETVWLNRQQMAALFNRDVKTIGKHINNALVEELAGLPTVANFAIVQKEGVRYVTRNVEYYNLDVVMSVGYRVKSQQGVLFRKWANTVLKDYLLKGYAIDNRLQRIEKKLYEHDEQIGVLLRTALPPREGLFFDGQVFDAFEFVKSLITSAKRSIVLIDNYISDETLALLADKNQDIKVDIYTKQCNETLDLAAQRFNQQYGNLHLHTLTTCHDRFMIIDNEQLYHIGASLKDLGKKWFAFAQLDAELIAAISMKLNQP